MINAIITYSVRHRWAVILAGVVLAALGLWAAADTPVDAIPDLSENQVIAFTEWAGHGPREIEDQVTYPLTLGLRGLAGVRVVRSSSDVGFSMISVIFEDGVAPAEARRLVGERLARVQAGLPRGAVPALAPDAAATGQIFWYALEGGGLDLGRLRAIQDWYVRPQIGSVRGVAEVASVGGFPIEYEVVPDPDRLRLFGVTTNDVGEAIAASNAAAAGHVVHKGAPSTSCAARAGWVPPRRPATIHRTRGGSSPTWKTWSWTHPEEGRSGLRRSPASRSRRASAAACWRKTAMRSPAAWS